MERVRPVDLRTRKGAEFLRVVDHTGDECEIRLDRIINGNQPDPVLSRFSAVRQ
jgi:hypothetical protein